MAANRAWRITGAFHKMADCVVTVAAPNLTSGIRKGALAIKRLPQLKGKRLVAASFTIHEVDRMAEVTEASEQPLLPGMAVPQGEPQREVGTQPSKVEPSEE